MYIKTTIYTFRHTHTSPTHISKGEFLHSTVSLWCPAVCTLALASASASALTLTSPCALGHASASPTPSNHSSHGATQFIVPLGRVVITGLRLGKVSVLTWIIQGILLHSWQCVGGVGLIGGNSRWCHGIDLRRLLSHIHVLVYFSQFQEMLTACSDRCSASPK